MKQRVYNVYRGLGVFAHMTYRVVPGENMSQFHSGTIGWQHSSVNEQFLRTTFPLVAKNVRFKA